MGVSRKYRDSDYICERCKKNIEGMNRIQQDEHEIECVKQKKLF